MNKKRDIFIKQGYSIENIEFLESCGVTTHLLWFLKHMKKKNMPINSETAESIALINNHIKTLGRNIYETFDMALTDALECKNKKELNIKNTLYTFEDGFSIIMLTTSELRDEGISMSNCVGNYMDKVMHKECGILALRNNKNKTVVHFEILKNGALSQNFEKGNNSVRHQYWKYVNEFFSKNSKNIDLSNYLGSGWKLNMPGQNNVINLDFIIPQRISQSININGEKISDICDSHVAKRFASKLPGLDIITNDKSKIIEGITLAKENYNRIFDEMLQVLENTKCESLYLSDNIKQRIFGEGNFYMNGNEYNFSDLTIGHGGEALGVDVRDYLLGEVDAPMEAQGMPEPMRLNEQIEVNAERLRHNIMNAVRGRLGGRIAGERPVVDEFEGEDDYADGIEIEYENPDINDIPQDEEYNEIP